MNASSDRYSVRTFMVIAILALDVALGFGVSATTGHSTASGQLAQPMPEDSATATFATSGDPYLGATLPGSY